MFTRTSSRFPKFAVGLAFGVLASTPAWAVVTNTHVLAGATPQVGSSIEMWRGQTKLQEWRDASDGKADGVVKVDVQREDTSDECHLVFKDKDGKTTADIKCAAFFFGGGSATVDTTRPDRIGQSGSHSVTPRMPGLSLTFTTGYDHLTRFDQRYLPFFTGGSANGSFALEEDVKLDGYSVGAGIGTPVGKILPYLGPMNLSANLGYTSAWSSTSKDSIAIPAGQTADIPNILGGANTAITSIQNVKFDADFRRYMFDVGLMGKDDLCEEGELSLEYGGRIKASLSQQSYDFSFSNAAQGNVIEQDVDTYRFGALGNLGVSRRIGERFSAGFGTLFGFGMQKTVYDARQTVGATSREVHEGGLWRTAPEAGVYGRIGYSFDPRMNAVLNLDHRYDFRTARPVIASENNSNQPSHIEYTTTSETRVTLGLRFTF